MRTLSKIVVLLVIVFGILLAHGLYKFYDNPNCALQEQLTTPDEAKSAAIAFWRSNPDKVKIVTPRYPTADSILKASEVDGRWDVKRVWSYSYFKWIWLVGFEIVKFTPEYYMNSVKIDDCGSVISNEKAS